MLPTHADALPGSWNFRDIGGVPTPDGPVRTRHRLPVGEPRPARPGRRWRTCRSSASPTFSISGDRWRSAGTAPIGCRNRSR